MSPKAFAEAMDTLFADPAYRPQFDIIYDRRAVQAQPDPRNANQMVAYMVAHRDRLAGCRWAMVVGAEVRAAMAGGRDRRIRQYPCGVEVTHIPAGRGRQRVARSGRTGSSGSPYSRV